MYRRLAPLLLALPFSFSACEFAHLGQPEEAATGLGGVQPSIEAEAAVASVLASCRDCRNVESLAQHLESRWAGCATIERVVETQSDCPGMGAHGIKASLSRCDLGLAAPVDATRLLVALGEADDWRFELVGMKTGVFGADSCGRISGTGAEKKLEFDTLATAPAVVAAGVRVAETLQIDPNGVTTRDGGGTIEIRAHSGVGYVLDYESKGLTRRKGEGYPSGGTIRFKDDDGMATLTFLPTTPETGEAKFAKGDGSEHTIRLGI